MANARAQVYKALNRPGFRFLLAAYATIQATVKARKFCHVTYDGAWIRQFPSGTLVERRLTLIPLSRFEEIARDVLMYQYSPAAGDIVVDIGAGMGWQTLCFSRRVGDSGRVIAIEAHPGTFACLNEMCRRNNLRNVTTINCAVAAENTVVHIGNEERDTLNSIVNQKSGISVLGLTLDTLFHALKLPRVDLLAMNIEGAERLAIHGMANMIRHTRCVCIACHDFRADEGDSEEMRSRADVVAFLKQNGFELTLRSSEADGWVRDYVYGFNRAYTAPAD